jgi:hypothetical protein
MWIYRFRNKRMENSAEATAATPHSPTNQDGTGALGVDVSRFSVGEERVDMVANGTAARVNADAICR